MNKKIYPSTVFGKIKAPSSKSFMQRAIAIALLANGKTTIKNPSFCNDALSAISMAKSLGANIKVFTNEVIIQGTEKIKSCKLSAGESGLGIRMFSAIAALSSEKIILSGEGSLLSRPISMIEGPLRDLSVDLKSNKSYLPIEIKGPIKGGTVKLNGEISSQFLSGLLIALPVAENDSIIEVKNLKSKPYIDMTLEIIKHFGVDIENQNYSKFIVKGGQKYVPGDCIIEGDWSAASFHLVAAAIGGNIEISGLNLKSKQADIKIVEALNLAGADIKIIESTEHQSNIQINKNKLNAFKFDATHCPDLFPPLVVLCSACRGTSTIKGVNRLKHKESNRASVLKQEMAKIGVNINITDNLMFIEGGEISSGKINSHNDHRIAMAAAIAGIVSNENGIIVEGIEAINKSYPEFFEDFKNITKGRKLPE